MWCGREFVVLKEGDEECIQCTEEIDARKPPSMLLDMQKVQAGQQPQTEAQKSLLMELRSKPTDFWDRMHKLDREYRSRVAGLSQERLAKAVEKKVAEALKARGTEEHQEQSGPDEGQARVDEQIQRLLGEEFERWTKEKKPKEEQP